MCVYVRMLCMLVARWGWLANSATLHIPLIHDTYYVLCMMYFVYERYVCVLVARCGWLANGAALCEI